MSAQSSQWLHCARSERGDVGRAGEGKRGKRREEERREGQKSRGGQALGGGRAKSQEHYIISGAESKREGYESVYWLHLSPSLDRGQSPCVWSPQYLSWSWDLWRLGQCCARLHVCVCRQTAGFVLHVRRSSSRGAHVEHWGPEESHRGLTRHWTVVSSAPLERNVAEDIREGEKPRQNRRFKKAERRAKSDVMEVGGSGCSWVETTEESWAESEALSNVRVHGQDCRVSTCHPLGLAAQAIIKPLGGATACHYSKTQTHTRIHTPAHAPRTATHAPVWSMLENWAKKV